MGKTRDEVIKILNRFLSVAEGRVDVKKIVLFGSTAKGTTRKWSDIDIAVISEDFEGMSKKERVFLLKRIAWDAKTTEIDALGYTTAEFSIESPLDLVNEIKEHGQTVYEKS